MVDQNYTIPNVIIWSNPIEAAAIRAAKKGKAEAADINVIMDVWKKTMADFEANLPSNQKKNKRK